MPRRRRNIEAFSLSFLDCICCGFGAIILLLVLSKIYEPVIIEKTQDDLESLIALLQQELFEIRGETADINRDLEDVRQQTSTTKLRLARLQGDLNDVRGQYAATQDDSQTNLDEGSLRETKQRLTDEMRRLQPYYRRAEEDAVAALALRQRVRVEQQALVQPRVNDEGATQHDAQPRPARLRPGDDEGVDERGAEEVHGGLDELVRLADVVLRERQVVAHGGSSPGDRAAHCLRRRKNSHQPQRATT